MRGQTTIRLRSSKLFIITILLVKMLLENSTLRLDGTNCARITQKSSLSLTHIGATSSKYCSAAIIIPPYLHDIIILLFHGSCKRLFRFLSIHNIPCIGKDSHHASSHKYWAHYLSSIPHHNKKSFK